MPSFETLLPLGAIAFYLFDSSLLLYGNEVAAQRLGKHWTVSGGWNLMFGGRRVYLPNPLAPHALLVRAQWTVAMTPEPSTLELLGGPFERSLRTLRWVIVALAALLFTVLPAVSFFYGAGLALLGVFAFAYGLVVAALGVIYFNRAEVGVSRRRFTGLALESLACVPFAINLVRKLSLARAADMSVAALLSTNVDPATRRQTAQLVCARIEEYLVLEDAGSARALELLALRDRVRSELSVAG